MSTFWHFLHIGCPIARCFCFCSKWNFFPRTGFLFQSKIDWMQAAVSEQIEWMKKPISIRTFYFFGLAAILSARKPDENTISGIMSQFIILPIGILTVYCHQRFLGSENVKGQNFYRFLAFSPSNFRWGEPRKSKFLWKTVLKWKFFYSDLDYRIRSLVSMESCGKILILADSESSAFRFYYQTD